MTHFEKAAKAAYESFNGNLIGCCEPTWEQLPTDFKERMIEAQIQAIRTYEQSIENNLPL